MKYLEKSNNNSPYLNFLFDLITENYILRMLKILPDEWYWADIELMALGFCVKI